MKISNHLKTVLEQSFALAKKSKHEFLTPEHILYFALSNDYVLNVLLHCETDVIFIRQSLETYLTEKVPVINGKNPIETMGYQSVMGRAILHCASADKKVVDIIDVVVSMLDEQKNHCCFYLKKAGLTRIQLLEAIGTMKEISDKKGFLKQSLNVNDKSDVKKNNY